MSLIGTNSIGKLILGATEMAKAYLGDDLVFQKGGGSILPAGYTQLQYVENSIGNSAYIDTGINPKTQTGFYIDAYSYDALSDSGFGCILGGRYSSGSSDYQLSTYSGTYDGVVYDGLLRTGAHGSGSAHNAHLSVNARIVAELSGNTYKVNGVSYTAPAYNITASRGRNIYLFALNNNGSVTQNGHLRVYAFSLTQNGNKVIDYIPCKNPNNVVGFYDLVSKSFISPTSGTLYGVE